MSCDETQNLIHGYMDGELDLRTSLAVERHLADCGPCALALQNQQALRAAIHESLYHAAPANLERRVRDSLRKAVRESAPKRQLSWRPLAVASAFGCVVLLAAILFIAPSRGRGPALAQELVSNHIRSLMASHLSDVASTDQHTVKPWFNGRLDFSPPVVDLAAQGFPLVGGRLDYVLDRPAAALVYMRNKHVINVFVWPAADAGAPTPESTERGYNLLGWTESGMRFAAVSDLNTTELRTFARMLRERTKLGEAGSSDPALS